jgi:hypothetical protein
MSTLNQSSYRLKFIGNSNTRQSRFTYSNAPDNGKTQLLIKNLRSCKDFLNSQYDYSRVLRKLSGLYPDLPLKRFDTQHVSSAIGDAKFIFYFAEEMEDHRKEGLQTRIRKLKVSVFN